MSSLSPGASSVTTGAASTGASAASIPTTTSGSSIGSNVLGSQLLSHSVSALQAQLNAATAISGATLSSSAVKSGDNRGTPIIHQKPTFGVNAAGPSSIVGVSLLGNVPISTVLTAHSGSLSANISATESSTNDPISLHNETLSGQSLMMYKWPQHGEQLVANIAQLIHEQQIVDVTLACDGQSLKAHKLVLSAGSSYFRELFAANPCKHPIVILKDIAAPELRLILHFMYRGELKVSHEQLPSLLKTAQLLQVRGLLETLKQRLIDDSINLSSVNASLRSLDSNSRPDCVVVSGHDSGFFSNPSIAAAIHKSGQSNGSSAPSVFGSSALGSVPVSTFGHIGASLAGLSGAFPTTNSLPFSSALNGPAALLAAELGPARYAAAALDLAALSQCRNGLSALDVCASDPDAANVPDHASNLLAAGSSLLLPTAFRNDLLQQQSRSAASGTTTAGTSHHLSVNDSYLGNAITNAANTDELLDELLCRSRKRRRGQPLSGLLRVGKPPFSASPSPGTFGRLSTGSMGNLSGSLPFASLNAIRGAESTLVNEAAGSVGSVLRARSTGANASSNTNGEVTCNETALSLVTSNRRSMSDLSHVSNVHDLSETNGCAAGSTGSTGSSGASSSSGSSSRNSSCPSQSGVTPAMLAATGLVASSAIAAATASNGSSTNRLGKDSSALDSDGGQACSDDESADVNALKNMRQLMHQAAAALSKQQTGALLALQRSSTPDNGSLIGRRSNRHSFPALDQLPEVSSILFVSRKRTGSAMPDIGRFESTVELLVFDRLWSFFFIIVWLIFFFFLFIPELGKQLASKWANRRYRGRRR